MRSEWGEFPEGDEASVGGSEATGHRVDERSVLLVDGEFTKVAG